MQKKGEKEGEENFQEATFTKGRRGRVPRKVKKAGHEAEIARPRGTQSSLKGGKEFTCGRNANRRNPGFRNFLPLRQGGRRCVSVKTRATWGVGEPNSLDDLW